MGMSRTAAPKLFEHLRLWLAQSDQHKKLEEAPAVLTNARGLLGAGDDNCLQCPQAEVFSLLLQWTPGFDKRDKSQIIKNK